jgi:hypothetical protein
MFTDTERLFHRDSLFYPLQALKQDVRGHGRRPEVTRHLLA